MLSVSGKIDNIFFIKFDQLFFRHISDPKEDWFRAMLSTIFTIHSEAPARFGSNHLTEPKTLVYQGGYSSFHDWSRGDRKHGKTSPHHCQRVSGPTAA